MPYLKWGKAKVMPFASKVKAKAFLKKIKKSGKYKRAGMGKMNKVYLVGAK